jgi:NADH dehydrogenase (ubiquinone) 1 alpha subcomplex subunit 5
MRRTFRQLAAVKPSQYLEAGAPTGLTGLYNHPSPRSALLYIYSQTLDKLTKFPETSLYRQSTEAITKHRMNIVSAIEPEGHAGWRENAKKVMSEHPQLFEAEANVGGNVVSILGKKTKEMHGGREFLTTEPQKTAEDPDEEWDGEAPMRGGVEAGAYMKFEPGTKKIELPEEPSLTAAQYVIHVMGEFLTSMNHLLMGYQNRRNGE